MSLNSSLRPKLLFAGMHPLILEDCRLRLSDHYHVEALDADEWSLLPAVERLQPDMVVVDLLFLRSLKTIERIREIQPLCRILAVTGMHNAEIIEASLTAGAQCLLYRLTAVSELPLAIPVLLAGRRYVSPALTWTAVNIGKDRQGQTPHLTGPDKCILHLVAHDYPAHQIAKALGLPLRAVRQSIADLKRRFQVRTTHALKQYAAIQDPAPDFP